MNVKSMFCSSLAKVLPDRAPKLAVCSGCALQGERFSFQLAYKVMDNWQGMLEVIPDSPWGPNLRMRKVGLVPVEYTGIEFDDDIISREPGLYPDLLSDLDPQENWVPALPSWRSLWFTLDIPEDCPPGTYPIHLTLRTFKAFETPLCYHEAGTQTFYLEVLDAVLPPQKLKVAYKIHTDCIASYYRVPVFSEDYWRLVENFMRNAADHGINMMLTPIFTPPLDTQIGSERPTVQLVDVTYQNGHFSFCFDKLERWVNLMQKCGFHYLEIAHLFTQWGAFYTPKIMATVEGKEKRIFGWDVRSDSPDYRKFLDAFLPELVNFLSEKKLTNCTYFHCSDEPTTEHLKGYKQRRDLLEKHLKGFKIMDAVSDPEFCRQGIVTTPNPIINNLEAFIAAGMKERWTYYCCIPTTVYPNRFIHMPSSRNRIFGTLLYLYDMEGTTHWGYNFYYSGLSRKLINPYQCNDSDFFYPAGDAFLVYPKEDGTPEDSIRLEVLYEAFQDQRVLEKLESYLGKDTLKKRLNCWSPTGTMTMANYPKGERAVLKLRETINQWFRQALVQYPDKKPETPEESCR